MTHFEIGVICTLALIEAQRLTPMTETPKGQVQLLSWCTVFVYSVFFETVKIIIQNERWKTKHVIQQRHLGEQQCAFISVNYPTTAQQTKQIDRSTPRAIEMRKT